jgi:GNAT superfamily N-acetyltransferase
MSVSVRDVSASSIDDVFRICSFSKLDDPLQGRGMEIKRKWLLEMLGRYGPCTKIAYLNDRPVAQILFYPEAAVPYVRRPREGAVVLHCAYNPFPDAQGRGVSTRLVRELIEECENGPRFLGGGRCSFIVARPFETDEGLGLGKFYEKNGFREAGAELYREISGRYVEAEAAERRPVPEDAGRAVVFYEPVCEWGYPFAVGVRDLIHEMAPGLPVSLFNSWERPREYSRRGREGLIVNGEAIRSLWTDREAFRREIEEALSR